MSGARTKSGLVCSHGSELDTRIPRPKMPRTALPECLRKKMGLVKRTPDNDENSNDDIWKAGSGVLKAVGSGHDGEYLKMKSGVAMSERASRLAQIQSGGVRGTANISKARLLDGTENALVLKNKTQNKRKSFDRYIE